MSSRRSRPLFSADAPDVHVEIPAEPEHPRSIADRLRRLLLIDVPLFTVEPESDE